MPISTRDFERDARLLKVLKGQLRHWFKFDHFRGEYGIALLVGVVPTDLSVIALTEYSEGFSSDVEFNFDVCLLTGEPVTVSPEYEYDERFFGAACRYERLLQYWKSGRHPDCTPLTYFVEWARSKGEIPDWEPVAEEMGFIQKNKPTVEGLLDGRQAEERRKRLIERVAEEKNKGNKSFLKTVAEEEGISRSRLKQLIDPNPKKNHTHNHWQGLATPFSQTERKRPESKY